MGQFDNVDLGNDKAMARMIKAEKEKRDNVIEECAKLVEKHDPILANMVRGLKEAS